MGIFNENVEDNNNSIEVGGNILFNPPYIRAMQEATLYNGDGISIAINPVDSRSMKGRPYFKVYDHENYEKAKHVARIYMTEPETIISHTKGSKPIFKMKSKDIEKMIKGLKSKPNGKYAEEYDTVWDAMLGELDKKYKDEAFSKEHQPITDLNVYNDLK